MRWRGEEDCTKTLRTPVHPLLDRHRTTTHSLRSIPQAPTNPFHSCTALAVVSLARAQREVTTAKELQRLLRVERYALSLPSPSFRTGRQPLSDRCRQRAVVDPARAPPARVRERQREKAGGMSLHPVPPTALSVSRQARAAAAAATLARLLFRTTRQPSAARPGPGPTAPAAPARAPHHRRRRRAARRRAPALTSPPSPPSAPKPPTPQQHQPSPWRAKRSASSRASAS
jgi:hypothetical protein